jgi:hypothetical protein
MAGGVDCALAEEGWHGLADAPRRRTNVDEREV